MVSIANPKKTPISSNPTFALGVSPTIIPLKCEKNKKTVINKEYPTMLIISPETNLPLSKPTVSIATTVEMNTIIMMIVMLDTSLLLIKMDFILKHTIQT